MEKEKRITTPYSLISKEKLYEQVGIILVLAHQTLNGPEILMEICKQTKKTEENDFGLPSETEKVNVDTNQIESKPSTLRRLGYQELGFDFKQIDLFFTPRNTYFETPFPITIRDEDRNPIKKVNALGKVIVLWTKNNDFLPKVIDNKEVKGARFELLDKMLRNPQLYQFRENSYRILNEVSKKGYLNCDDNLVRFRKIDRYPHYIYSDKHLSGNFRDVYVKK